MGDVIDISDKLLGEARRAEGVASVLGALATSGEILPLAELTQIYVRAAVAASGGNKSRAARALGISRWALHRMLRREAA